nr:regulatory signaling modulator protein AmpE [uncultured Pseudomonas sp.]
MSFLVLILVLWFEKFSGLRHLLQRDGFFVGELARLQRKRGLHPGWVLAIAVLAPVVVLSLLLYVLEPVAYGLLALPVHLLVLVYSLGRGDAKASLGPLRDAWRRGDEQAALHVAARDLDVVADGPRSLREQLQSRLLWEAYQGFFAVIFWYFVLGPAAALAYRLLALCETHSQQPALARQAGQLRHVMDWVPVRVVALSFALVGNFVAVAREMLHELLNWHVSAAHLVARIGRIADAGVDGGNVDDREYGLRRLDSLWDLVLRCGVLWYAAFALWTVLA